MPRGAYTIIRKQYNRWWEEEELVVAEGSMIEQGQRLFDGLKEKLGPKIISLTLYDKEGNIIEQHIT